MALKFLSTLQEIEKNHRFLATKNKQIVALSDEDFKTAINHASPTVYFIRSRNYIKIGHTRGSMASRMAALQTGNPEELELLFAWKTTDAQKIERIFQSHFAHRHKRGEWYELTEEDFKGIEMAIKIHWGI